MSTAPLVNRADFPVLARRIDDRPIIYLDSAATTLKPRSVIDRVVQFYERHTANVHRGNHTLSQEASEGFEATRDSVARFINATAREVVFTANATEGLNLVAEGMELRDGDNVVASVLEHHSNLMPWMRRCEVRLAPEASDGRIDLAQLERLIDDRTRMVALTHVSNITGAINPIRQVAELAHHRKVPLTVDGSQSVPHLPVDVAALGCDFLSFSGHKMLGPSGIGVLYISAEMRDRLPPLKTGGGTVDHVRSDGYSLKRAPHRFEAGTPNIEGVLGLGAAIEYLERVGMERVAEYDAALTRVVNECFSELPGVRLLGPRNPSHKIAVASLLPTGAVDANGLGIMLSDSFKVMARAGTHCAHPYFATYDAPGGSVRLSAYLYNTEEEIRQAAAATRTALERLGARP